MIKQTIRTIILLAAVASMCVVAVWADSPIETADGTDTVSSGLPLWAWPLLVFLLTFALGIVAVMGGVGGGVLFVPIAGSFFPFHLDYVRGAGLIIALTGSLTAGPTLLRSSLVNLRVALPLAVMASASAICGAMVGLALDPNVVQTALGFTILGIVALMWVAKRSEFPHVEKQDPLGAALKMHGMYHEESTDQDCEWKTHRTPLGMALFIVIGFLAGMFGLGAGWANVPVLNLVLGAPLKVSVATSHFLLSIVDTSAAWIYLHRGAVLAIITVPAVAGIMLGTQLGVRLLKRARASVIRRMVLVILLLAGVRAILKGLGIWN